MGRWSKERLGERDRRDEDDSREEEAREDELSRRPLVVDRLESENEERENRGVLSGLVLEEAGDDD